MNMSRSVEMNDFRSRKDLPDGRIAVVVPTIFGGRITVSTDAKDFETGWSWGAFDYHSIPAAIAALEGWTGEGEPSYEGLTRIMTPTGNIYPREGETTDGND